MRSRKLPSAGAAAGFLFGCDARLSGRCIEDRGVARVEAGCGFGRVVVGGLPWAALPLLRAGAASCLAREAAVGAVRREGRSTGFVPCLALGLEGGDCLDEVDTDRSGAAARATEAAVGAVRELRLAFLLGCFFSVGAESKVLGGVAVLGGVVAFAEDGVFG